jgi:hypothetical protein
MFDSTSRYARLAVLAINRADGTPVAYVSRRFLPAGSSLPLLAEIQVDSSDRPDLLASRTLGDPTVFWRIADANDVMDPGELMDDPGETVRIPVPQP